MSKKTSRRNFMQTSGYAAAGTLLTGKINLFASPTFDIIIKNATIFDGTGAKEWPADIGISGDRIRAIEKLGNAKAEIIIDAQGKAVCPGFIDMHTHSDGDIFIYPGAESKTMQGVTTEVTGNCGFSTAPLKGYNEDERRKRWLEEDDLETKWGDLDAYINQLQETGLSINHAPLLGQGTLRQNLIGAFNRPLTTAEMKQLIYSLEEGMAQGAFGLSTGLEYVPGSYTSTNELIEMSKVVARYNGLYATHMRDEEAMLLEAINESIEIGRQSGVRVEISHLKASGRANWSKQTAALNLIESARRDGINVLADAYPYTAFSTGLTSFIPTWAREGSRDDIMARLDDKETYTRLRMAVVDAVQNSPGDFSLIVISRVKTEQNQSLVGKSISEISDIWSINPPDVLLRLLREEESRVGFVGHGMSPENVKMVLSHPLVMIGSDGSAKAAIGEMLKTKPHPRSYGTFPRVLGYYSRQEKLFDFRTAIKKMTSMPANQLRLSDRGTLSRNKIADIVIFDPETVIDQATFANPHQYPLGIDYVLVNGKVVVEKGEHTGVRAGKVLRFS